MKEVQNLPFEPSNKPPNEPEKKISGAETGKRTSENWRKKPSFFAQFDREILETKRTTEVTAGGRRFRFASAGLVKDKTKNLVTFAYTKGKEVPATFQKMLRK